MKSIVIAAIALAASAFAAQAQINWNFTDANTTPDGGVPPNVIVSDLTAGNSSLAINSTSASTGYTGASGGNNAAVSAVPGTLNISTSTYYQFTLTPASGYQINATDFTFGNRSTASGPTVLSLRSSIDGYTTDLASQAVANDSVWRLVTMAFTATGAIDEAVTFRLYGSGGSSTASNWRIDDLNFTASAALVPEPSTYAMIGLGATLLVGMQRFRRKN